MVVYLAACSAYIYVSSGRFESYCKCLYSWVLRMHASTLPGACCSVPCCVLLSPLSFGSKLLPRQHKTLPCSIILFGSFAFTVPCRSGPHRQQSNRDSCVQFPNLVIFVLSRIV
mmetsp:Transcript_68474/g.180541  ORF Transcript_68474/g.180541 Transcript_68474/m.180541 type:complete len:114 (+) Transcript_68474:801-1142(+)